eukprot:s2788_g5.t1
MFNWARTCRESARPASLVSMVNNYVEELEKGCKIHGSLCLSLCFSPSSCKRLAEEYQWFHPSLKELSEEREKRQAAEQKLLQFEVAGFSDATAATAAVQAKTAELEKAHAMQQLAEVRSELGSARLAAEACRPSLSSAVTIPVQSFPTATMFGTEYPMASGVTNGFPSTIMEGPGAADIFDPWQFPGGPQRAVIVGCDYAGKPGALRAAIADSVYWLRHFQKRCCMEKPDLRYLCDAPEGRPPADLPGGPDPICAPATCDNIRRGLRWLTHRSVPGEQLFFIFCGNGAQLPVRSDSSSTKMCESVLIPGDARGPAHSKVT